MIGLINYGSGNIHAIANIYNRLNIPFFLVTDPLELNKANKLILPGVGDFDETMMLLRQRGLIDALDEFVRIRKVPILGVCVGMQVLGDRSEEGSLSGFGWIKGNIRKLDAAKIAKKPYLPHMGWNSINILKDNFLLKDIDAENGFYFLHNYYFDCDHVDDIVCTTNYGITFPVVVNHDNVYGTQFHPEKSHKNGIAIFKNFANNA